MSSPSWGLTDRDRQFFALELDDFVPDRLYDAHAHLGERRHYSVFHRDGVANTPEVADMSTYRAGLPWLAPERELAGVTVIPNTLDGENLDEGNRFAAEQARLHPGSGPCTLIHPSRTAEELEADIERYRSVALKPYHLMSARERTMESTVAEFLPEHAVAVAHETGLPIILHLVHPTALADARNQEAVTTLCRNYPDMRLVLAHAARGFNPSHTIRGIDGVAGLDNLFFDTSCVAESGAMEAILRVYGHSRLMWGSDYPFSHMHGRCVGIGDSFAWLYDSDVRIGELSPDPDLEFVLVGLESLRALKIACLAYRLSPSQIEAVFCDNARELFRH